MTNYNDLKRNFFNSNSVGNFTNAWDAELKALQQKTGSTSTNINDLWKLYFKGLGYTVENRHISDIWYDYLGDLGYTGSLRDRKKKYFTAGTMT